MSDFLKGLLITAIPIVVLSVVSMAGAAVEGIYYVWLGAIALWWIAIVTAIGYTIARKGQIAAGIVAGLGIGIVSLGATCFANFAMGFGL